MAKKATGGEVTIPLRDIEKQGYHALREWPVVIVRRMKQLEVQLAVMGVVVDEASRPPALVLTDLPPPGWSRPVLPEAVKGTPVETVKVAEVPVLPETAKEALPVWSRSLVPNKASAPQMASVDTQLLAVDRIRIDGGTQIRTLGTVETVVAEYAQMMSEGNQFPPLTVYFDGTVYWLADGFHRLAAARQLVRTEIAVRVVQGTQRDAMLHGIEANREHGLRYSNQDKRNAIQILLKDAAASVWPDSEIARFSGTDRKTVGRVRDDLVRSGLIKATPTAASDDKFKVGD